MQESNPKKAHAGGQNPGGYDIKEKSKKMLHKPTWKTCCFSLGGRGNHRAKENSINPAVSGGVRAKAPDKFRRVPE